MTNIPFGINPDELDDEEFVGNQLANSALVGQIVDIVAPTNLTTDDAVGISIAVDMSGSMSSVAITDAVIQGYNTMLDTLATTSERRQMFVQTVTYDTEVTELHTFKRLVNPQDNKTLNVPYLDRSTYRPSMGGMTASINALMKVAADNRYFETVLGMDDVDVNSRHVIVLITDGFVNRAVPDAAAQIRRFIKRLSYTEKWTFLMFCMADKRTANDFTKYLQQAVNFQGTPEEGAQVMFEAMATGWGYWVDDPGDIDSIANPADRKRAQMYYDAEQIILKHFMSSYAGIGGMGIPYQNVLTVWHDPEQIIDLIGAQVSNSIIRASQGKITVSAVPQQTNNSVF